MLDFLLSVIAPHVCLGCGREGSLWCPACRAGAPLAADRCFRCHALSVSGRTCVACRRSSGLHSVQAATRYENIPKQLVWKLKFGRAQAASRDVASVMASRLTVPAGALMTHIPTSTSHVRRRGYDQASVIAREFSRQTGAQHQTLLMRLGQAEQHTATRVRRLTQLHGAFVPLRTNEIYGRHIILIDDVITTGATLDAAAKALKSVGAKRVSALVFAQA